MREYSDISKNRSHTLDSNRKASRQASVSDILQAYTKGSKLVQTKNNNFSITSIHPEIFLTQRSIFQTYANDSFTKNHAVIQGKFERSEDGEDGVLIEDGIVIKLGGFDEFAIPLDRLAASFGFKSTNAKVVTSSDTEWETVKRAVQETGGNKLDGITLPEKALIMDKLVGVPLYRAFENDKGDTNMNVLDAANPTETELQKIVKMCDDLGRMLVMDLLTRNNDRFNLVDFDDDLLATPDEKTLVDGWRFWMANEGNMLVDSATGETNPIDSQFTNVDDEKMYAENIASLLTSKIDELVTTGLDILIGCGCNWGDMPYAKSAFKQGIENGIKILLNMRAP